MIRAYGPADYEVCRALWAELTEHHRELYANPSIGGEDPGEGLDRYLERPDRAGAWVAVDGDSVVGFVGLLLEDGGAEIEPIMVAASCRSRGFGRALLEAAIEAARVRGARYVKARPVSRNAGALALFHEAGFDVLTRVELTRDVRPRGRTWRPGPRLHGLEYRI